MRNCFTLKLQEGPRGIERIAIADLTNMGEMVSGTMTITRINVPSEFRGRGYGSLLLKQVLTAADHDLVRLSLEIYPSGPLSHDDLEAWYKRHGFIQSKWLPGIYIRRPVVQN